MGIPFTILMGFLFTMTMGILFTILLGIQFTISTGTFRNGKTSQVLLRNVMMPHLVSGVLAA